MAVIPLPDQQVSLALRNSEHEKRFYFSLQQQCGRVEEHQRTGVQPTTGTGSCRAAGASVPALTHTQLLKAASAATTDGSQQQPEQGAACCLSEASWHTQSLLLPRLLTFVLSFLPAPNFCLCCTLAQPRKAGRNL